MCLTVVLAKVKCCDLISFLTFSRACSWMLICLIKISFIELSYHVNGIMDYYFYDFMPDSLIGVSELKDVHRWSRLVCPRKQSKDRASKFQMSLSHLICILYIFIIRKAKICQKVTNIQHV